MKLFVPICVKSSSSDSSIIGERHMPDSSSQIKWCLATAETTKQIEANAFIVLEFNYDYDFELSFEYQIFLFLVRIQNT